MDLLSNVDTIRQEVQRPIETLGRDELRVAFVDDDRSLSLLQGFQLERIGIHNPVTICEGTNNATADSAVSTLRAARREQLPPHVVFCDSLSDCWLDENTQLTRANPDQIHFLRVIEEAKHAGVKHFVLVTSYKIENLVGELNRLHCQGDCPMSVSYIQKPYNHETLDRALSSHPVYKAV